MEGQLDQQLDQVRRRAERGERLALAEDAIAQTRPRFGGERHAMERRDDVDPVHRRT